MEALFALEKEALKHQYAITKITENGESDLERFYSGCNVFVTGGSGFLGKLLVEKLLRSCNVNKVMILLRPKKGKAPQQRANEILKDPVFDTLRKLKPDFEENVIAMEGDVSEIKLGLSSSDWNIITNEVNIILHAAATVNFEETFKIAIMTNVRGTRDILSLAKACKNLRSVVHVSTAYSHATKSRVMLEVKEQFYDSPMPPVAVIAMVEKMEDEKLNSLMRIIMKDWPNTYTFSKALGEEVVRTEAQNLPICIVRPAIVIPSFREPSIGWVDPKNAYGASGIVLGALMGIIHVLMAKSEKVISFVPVDIVGNAIIAAGWVTAKQKTNEDIMIYNVTNNRNPILWRDFFEVLNTDARNLVSPRTVWYCFGFVTRHKVMYLAYTWLLHTIPAFFIDNICKLANKRLKLLSIYKKIYKLTSVLQFFTNNDWKFEDDNTLSIYNNMSINDRYAFNCNIAAIDYKELILFWIFGVRKYIIKDGLHGTDLAVKKQFWFRIITYIILFLYVYLFYKIVITVYRMV